MKNAEVPKEPSGKAFEGIIRILEAVARIIIPSSFPQTWLGCEPLFIHTSPENRSAHMSSSANLRADHAEAGDDKLIR